MPPEQGYRSGLPVPLAPAVLVTRPEFNGSSGAMAVRGVDGALKAQAAAHQRHKSGEVLSMPVVQKSAPERGAAYFLATDFPLIGGHL